MKELSIEEKAKAYDEALKRAKNHHDNDGLTLEQYETIDIIFPELKENEDERIRKELIDYFSASHVTDTFRGISWDSVVAWLEKQGEQKPSWSEEDEEIVEALNTYVKNLDIFFSEIKIGDKDILAKEFREKVQHWLKSLKERMQH